MKFSYLLILILSLPQLGYGYAESPFLKPTRNYDLREQIKGDPHRMVPLGEKYALAADFNVWKYWKDTETYYHGPGYWIDAYFEYQFFEDLSLNLKGIFGNGTTSNGYNRSSFLQTIAGVTWAPQVFDDEWNFMMRFFDLDRTTVGAGLFLEDREMSGLLVQIDNGRYFSKLRLPGTSVLQVPGDLWSLEVYRESSVNRFGLSSFFVDGYASFMTDPNDPSMVNVTVDSLSPVSSIFLTSRPDKNDPLIYRLQVARSNEEWAGMAAFGLQDTKDCLFCYKIMGQYRYYEDGIIDNLAGNMQYDFIPFSFHERAYQNAHNIFFIKDQTQSYGANVSFKFDINSKWVFESFNEFGIFDYKNIQDDDFFFSTQRFGFCPYEGLYKNCLYFYYSNKIVNARDPYTKLFASRPILYKEDVLGLYGVFYL